MSGLALGAFARSLNCALSASVTKPACCEVGPNDCPSRFVGGFQACSSARSIAEAQVAESGFMKIGSI